MLALPNNTLRRHTFAKRTKSMKNKIKNMSGKYVFYHPPHQQIKELGTLTLNQNDEKQQSQGARGGRRRNADRDISSY